MSVHVSTAPAEPPRQPSPPAPRWSRLPVRRHRNVAVMFDSGYGRRRPASRRNVNEHAGAPRRPRDDVDDVLRRECVENRQPDRLAVGVHLRHPTRPGAVRRDQQGLPARIRAVERHPHQGGRPPRCGRALDGDNRGPVLRRVGGHPPGKCRFQRAQRVARPTRRFSDHLGRHGAESCGNQFVRQAGWCRPLARVAHASGPRRLCCCRPRVSVDPRTGGPFQGAGGLGAGRDGGRGAWLHFAVVSAASGCRRCRNEPLEPIGRGARGLVLAPELGVELLLGDGVGPLALGKVFEVPDGETALGLDPLEAGFDECALQRKRQHPFGPAADGEPGRWQPPSPR